MHQSAKNLLDRWNEEVKTSLIEGFRQLFDSSSQVLLEFADAAENNRLQRLFFDAQREFYLKEETIVSDFERALMERLKTFSDQPQHNTQLGADTLSLVEVDDYERSLALETIANRAADKQSDQLHALSQRLSALLGGRPIQQEQLPAHPLQIIRIFDPASRKLEVEKEVRLVFYTLFDRYVVSRLGELYASLNQRLVDKGILPNIKFEYQRFGPSQTAAQGTDAATADADQPTGGGQEGQLQAPVSSGTGQQRLRPAAPTSAETLKAISSLLMAKRQAEQDAAPLQTSTPILATAGSVSEAIADDLVMREAPHPLPIPEGASPSKVAVDAELLVKVKAALQKQRQIIKNLVGKDKLDTREEDVIDIVGMLFEAMLNEKLLPNSVKTLLSHLHTRYLKIAVQSPDFLENNNHPARRLFERMLDAGIRWVREDNLRAGIYPLLQDIVKTMLKDEPFGDGFYDEQIRRLDEQEKKLERQTSAAEERTLETERGRARLDQAKGIVRDTIEAISGSVEVAPAVATFLTTTYSDYLTLLLLRNQLDTDSESWRDAYAVGEALVAAAVYSAQGKSFDEKMLSEMKQRLEHSVGSLIPHHEQNIRRVMSALASPPEKLVTADTGPEAPTAAETPAAAPQTGAIGESATARAETFTVEDAKMADKLMREAGNWFVMKLQGQGEEQEQAVKLLWVNPHTRNMLFVDQHGAKVALMPAGNVAKLIREGVVRPKQAEASSFVARSLRRIRRALEDSINA